MMSVRSPLNQRSLAFIVLISGIVGGLLIVFSILLLCKYCLNRRNLREAEQMKLLYEALNQASFTDPNRFYAKGIRESSPLEPRRSNPLDRYLLQEEQWQIPRSKPILSDYHLPGGQTAHNQSYHSSREHLSVKSHDSSSRRNVANDEEQAYLQVDPRCYVRQNSSTTLALLAHRKSDTPRLEKGHSLNADTRPSPSSLSPYRQSSFDVNLAYRSQQQQQQPSSPTSLASTQPDIYYTPRGSSLSVMGNPVSNTPTSSQHLSPPTPTASRKNSIALIIEKKDLTATLDTFGNQPLTVRSSVVQREHEHSRSLEYSSPPVQHHSTTSSPANDKQSRSFDAVHLLRPGVNRSDVVNRRTKSYECADERRPSTSSIAPAPIVIKIPDMSELVQAAQLSRIQNRRESTKMEEYQSKTGRKETLVQQFSNNDDQVARTASQDLWRLRQSYELEEQQQLDRTSPEDLSPDLLTSTSIDSAGAMPIHNSSNHNPLINNDENPLKYHYRRKSSSNLLLPPPEVRRQALRRTFEKRRSCINQSNARREQQLLHDPMGLDDENLRNPVTKLSTLLNNFNSKSENSSFERSLETDFDMQSDTSSRGHNDQFTSIESSGNENALPDATSRYITTRRQQQQSSPQISPQQNDSGYKSLESQNSQNRTISLDWMSADGGESVIYLGDSRIQQRSVDIKDLDEDLVEQEQQGNQLNTNRRSPKLLHAGLQHSYQETSTNLIQSGSANAPLMQNRSLSTNIPFVDHSKPSPINLSAAFNSNPMNQLNNHHNHNNNNSNKLSTSSSFIRTASKKRREFGKDKKHASSNASLPPLINDERQITVHQINETTEKFSSLQVRHPDLRRTRSDGARTVPPNTENSSTNELTANPNTRLSSSADGLPVVHSPSGPIRHLLSPNSTDVDKTRVTLQRSPSSTTSPVTLQCQTDAFRSQRNSVSFDTQSSSTTKSKSPPSTNSIFPTCVTKSRLKFSMVRESAMTGLGHSAPVYSMPITRDYSIDEKTNRIVNEFLMHDPTLDDKKNFSEDNLHRTIPKRYHHRVRPKTFDETTATSTSPTNSHKQPRSPVNKQRHQNSLQTYPRKHPQYHYPSVHLPENIEQKEAEEKEGDSSDQSTPSLLSHQQSTTAGTRRDNSIASGSPSIIITGDDSGS
ncbi:unnamed protein product [Adineta ricciae]|uniref:Uncharacterized protein n=2 Tax=Adineta ricciae TaxID=249248 RepID=A0A815BPX4_ADIRI|nr:unnamed protein product [Adineta ricciae]